MVLKKSIYKWCTLFLACLVLKTKQLFYYDNKYCIYKAYEIFI